MTESQGVLLADRYRLVEQLGRGGMGVVWRAHDEVFNREVAVKEVLLPAELPREDREGVIRRTLREARVAAKLSHPNVVKVYDVVRAGGRPWIVMELVQAQSLTDLIERNGPLPPAEVARIGLQVLAGLGAAHSAGINHRDVKPGNVLCTDAGRVVLTDFGIASLEGDNSATATGPLMGSPSYIAPERVRGRPASPASDLWSLAATLYAAVEGRPPYDRDGIVATVTAVVNEEPDPVRLAGALGPVLGRMFKKDPAERPSAAQTRIMLREVAGAPNHRDVDRDEVQPRAALEASAVPAAAAAAETMLLRTEPRNPPSPYPSAQRYDAAEQHAIGHPYDNGDAHTEVLAAGAPEPAFQSTGSDFPPLREPVHPVVAALAVTDSDERPVGPSRRRAQVALAGLAVVTLLGGGAWGLRALNSSDEQLPANKAAQEEPTASATPTPDPSPQVETPADLLTVSPSASPTKTATIPVRRSPAPRPVPPAPQPSAPPSPSSDPSPSPSATASPSPSPTTDVSPSPQSTTPALNRSPS